MRNNRHKGKQLITITMAIACVGLALLWPQWQDALRAQDYEEAEEAPEEEAPEAPEEEAPEREAAVPPGDSVKRAVTAVSLGLGVASGASWLTAELCLAGVVTAPCSIPAGIIAAGTATAAALGGLFVFLDPSDPNFMVIPDPTPPPVTLVIGGKDLTHAEAGVLNALLRNEARMVGLLRAMVTAVNRAQGALEAGDTFWEAKQREALSKFQSALGQVYKNEAALREVLVDLLERNHFPQVTITPDQIFDLQTTLAETGWPPELKSFLLEIGNDEATIEEVRLLVSTLDVNAAAGDFPASLAKPELLSALREAGEALAPPPHRR